MNREETTVYLMALLGEATTVLSDALRAKQIPRPVRVAMLTALRRVDAAKYAAVSLTELHAVALHEQVETYRGLREQVGRLDSVVGKVLDVVADSPEHNAAARKELDLRPKLRLVKADDDGVNGE